MNSVVLLHDQEIGPENATHEVILFSQERRAFEGTVIIQKEPLERGGSVNRAKVERHESPHQIRLPEGRRKNQTHQALEQVLVLIQKGEIFNGLEEFRSSSKLFFEPFCEAAPIIETGGNISSPKLYEGSQTEYTMKGVLFQHRIQKPGSLKSELPTVHENDSKNNDKA
jgi:hypothetical protein